MHVDQMHREAMSGYVNPHVKTPAMDRIAEDGCSFRASICHNARVRTSAVVLVHGAYVM